MEIIQWFSDPFWSQDVVLGDDIYTITGKYNTRDESWYCDIANSSGDVLVQGRKVVIWTDMLKGVTNENSPNGVIFVASVVENIEEVTRDNMGSDVKLFYIDNNEINEILR